MESQRKDQFRRDIDSIMAIEQRKIKRKEKRRERKCAAVQASKQVKSEQRALPPQMKKVELVISGDQKKRKI